MSRGVIYRIGAPAERGRNRCGNQSPQGTPSSCSATPAPQQSLAAVVLCCVIVPVLGTGNGSVFRLGVQPAPPSDFIASLALGASHTCVLMSDGDVRCWGGNSRGQLGSGGFTDALLPTGVAAFTGALKLAAGGWTTCVISNLDEFPGESEGVTCWGANDHSQLGLQSYEDVPTAPRMSVTSGDLTVATSAGSFTCVITDDQTARCWGSNSNGQLGIATSQTAVLGAPWGYDVASNVTRIALGYDHVCALLTSTCIECWGGNDWGQLGDGTTVSVWSPRKANILHGVSQVSAGNQFTCALTRTGEVMCWGRNDVNQLGDGSTNSTVSPVGPVLSGVIDITSGEAHTCAVIADRTVWCWGSNGNGQLGNGLWESVGSPVKVQGLTDVIVIAAGGNHTCALCQDGSLWCWGSNGNGQLGTGDRVDSSVPVFVHIPPELRPDHLHTASVVPAAVCAGISLVLLCACFLRTRLRKSRLASRRPSTVTPLDALPNSPAVDSARATVDASPTRRLLQFQAFSTALLGHEASDSRRAPFPSSGVEYPSFLRPSARHSHDEEKSTRVVIPIDQRSRSSTQAASEGIVFPAGYVGPLRPLNATPLSAEASTPSFALEDFKPRSLLSFTTSSAIFTADWDRSGSPSVPATLHVDWSTDAIESREGNLLRRELKVYAALSVKKHVLGLLGHFTGTLPAAWLKLSTPAVAVSPRLQDVPPSDTAPQEMQASLEPSIQPHVVIAESDAGVLSEPNPVSAPLSRRPLKLPPIRIDPFNAGSYPLPTPRSLAGHSVPSSRSSARDTDVRITVFSPRSNGDAGIPSPSPPSLFAVFEGYACTLRALSPSSSSLSSPPSAYSTPPLPFDTFAKIARHVFETAMFLQTQDMVHTRLNCDTLVVTADGMLRITDLGHAFMLAELSADPPVTAALHTENMSHFAPEIVGSTSKGSEVSTIVVPYGSYLPFAIGIILCEVALGEHPLGRGYPMSYTRPEGLAVSCTLPLAQLTHADGRVLYDSSEVLSVPVPYLEQLSALGYPDDFIPVIRRMLSLQPTERLSLPQAKAEFEEMLSPSLAKLSLKEIPLPIPEPYGS